MGIEFKTFRNLISFVLAVEMLDDSHIEVILKLAAIGIFKVFFVAIVYDPDCEL